MIVKRNSRAHKEKRIVIIAGPNGAGKTTFALEFLPNEAECPIFINADLIAAGLSPFDPALAAIKAGRLMLQAIQENVQKGESFAFETTLSGIVYARRIPQWQKAGYHVTMFFLSLPSPELAVARVRERVRRGGHNVPEPDIRRRFDVGLRNFQNVYRELVDSWSYYNNSDSKPVLLDWGEKK
jgi:predicted ABC-type ATPase